MPVSKKRKKGGRPASSRRGGSIPLVFLGPGDECPECGATGGDESPSAWFAPSRPAELRGTLVDFDDEHDSYAAVMAALYDRVQAAGFGMLDHIAGDFGSDDGHLLVTHSITARPESEVVLFGPATAAECEAWLAAADYDVLADYDDEE